MRGQHKRRRNAAGAATFALLLAGCAATPLPYQARTGSEPAYGYADGKIDALHYSIVYTDNNRARADDFLELRAAEIARDAGYAYFVFDKRDTGAATKFERQFGAQPPFQAKMLGLPSAANSYLPEVSTSAVTQYFYAGGEISLLTPLQVQGNAKAIAVADVLAKMAPNRGPDRR
jgi:hypothetical protein